MCIVFSQPPIQELSSQIAFQEAKNENKNPKTVRHPGTLWRSLGIPVTKWSLSGTIIAKIGLLCDIFIYFGVDAVKELLNASGACMHSIIAIVVY